MLFSGLTLENASASEKEYKVKEQIITVSSCKDYSLFGTFYSEKQKG